MLYISNIFISEFNEISKNQSIKDKMLSGEEIIPVIDTDDYSIEYIDLKTLIKAKDLIYNPQFDYVKSDIIIDCFRNYSDSCYFIEGGKSTIGSQQVVIGVNNSCTILIMLMGVLMGGDIRDIYRDENIWNFTGCSYNFICKDGIFYRHDMQSSPVQKITYECSYEEALLLSTTVGVQSVVENDCVTIKNYNDFGLFHVFVGDSILYIWCNGNVLSLDLGIKNTFKLTEAKFNGKLYKVFTIFTYSIRSILIDTDGFYMARKDDKNKIYIFKLRNFMENCSLAYMSRFFIMSE